MDVLRTVVLESLKIGDAVRPVYERFLAEVEANGLPKNTVRAADYRRWTYILDVLGRHDELSDIGIGHGQFVQAARNSGKFGRIKGADIRRYEGIEKVNGFDFIQYDLTTQPPTDLRSGVVTCMECIEHIAGPDFDTAVANLKRLARARLIVTVPYAEKEPLPSYHFQRFTVRRLLDLFPGGEVTLLANGPAISWAMVDWHP
jgi:hypothetical protein